MGRKTNNNNNKRNRGSGKGKACNRYLIFFTTSLTSCQPQTGESVQPLFNFFYYIFNVLSTANKQTQTYSQMSPLVMKELGAKAENAVRSVSCTYLPEVVSLASGSVLKINK